MEKPLLTYIGERLGMGILNFSSVGGGSINQVYYLQTKSEKLLLKLNNKEDFPGMFKAEAEGLDIIRRTNSISVPEIILQDEFGNDSFLVMEWIDNKRPGTKASILLGEKLAQMHRNTTVNFGAVADNYMGSLKQSNQSHTTWAEFYIEERLKPIVQIAIDKHLINNDNMKEFDQLYKNIPRLFDEEKSSLIHGDLWSGNYLIGIDDRPYLIDPAITFGHREFDIAMTTLFGGFSNEFYEAYQYHFPLNEDWQQRIDLWNLYPLLVHLNLFGLGYLGQVKDCLKQYI
ncbi:fructosamine kinase family protein [Mucilaginibacter sp. McL0603]|uniref:fructosamine kinase family protein n=1 Tax=Mucilaginibacter sp. McL0603 TaxID=3415670 RepID=UPI003CEF8EDA